MVLVIEKRRFPRPGLSEKKKQAPIAENTLSVGEVYGDGKDHYCEVTIMCDGKPSSLTFVRHRNTGDAIRSKYHRNNKGWVHDQLYAEASRKAQEKFNALFPE